MLNAFEAGCLYLNFTVLDDTFLKVMVFRYSPPGRHPFHSNFSEHSKPKFPVVPILRQLERAKLRPDVCRRSPELAPSQARLSAVDVL